MKAILLARARPADAAGDRDSEETADALQVSPGTVMHDWRLAKVWLLRELSRR